MKKQIGQTKTVGFQFGIRKTFSISLDQARAFMFSKKGLDIWLGEFDAELEEKVSFVTKNGIEASIRIFKPASHIRLNWKMKDWINESVVQVRIYGNDEKATIAFHQEKLNNAEQRNEMKAYWTGILKRITFTLNQTKE